MHRLPPRPRLAQPASWRLLALPGRQHARGVVLIVVLVILVALGITSAAMLREVCLAHQVSNNLRLQSFADQAAHLALRYCEQQVLYQTGQVSVVARELAPPADAPGAWRSASAWSSAVRVPANVWHAAALDVALSADQVPQCLAERSADLPGLLPGEWVLTVTARGFSPDYRLDAAGRRLTGAVVWLQSQQVL